MDSWSSGLAVGGDSGESVAAEFNKMAETASPKAPEDRWAALRRDLGMLTKFRLSVLVLVTTMAGYLAGAGAGFAWREALHTLIGTAAVAFGAAVFNQLMEIEPDSRMRRTADRPLPARRMPTAAAFAFGWIVSALGILHLALNVRPENPQAAYLAAITLGVYIFIYTPMKRKSSANTLVGGVAGAIPPVIGWTAAGQGYDAGALALFSLLFFWQMPHFVAINWLHREEYERAGFVMWSNGDHDGRRSAALCWWFSLALAGVALAPVAFGLVGPGHLAMGALCSVVVLWLAWKFRRDRSRESARRLFLFTLLFLPLVLGSMLAFWRAG